MYKHLNTLGHNCYIVAPVTDQSGVHDGTLFTTVPHLTSNSQWDVVKAGAASIGTDPNDNHIWYYNGTSAAQVLVALDYVLPTFANFKTPDLVISGPNPGWALGPFVYTISGSIGATIVAIERGIPAIALSSGNTERVPYNGVSVRSKVGLQDPATITAQLASTLIQSLIDKATGSAVLPKGYGITVNMPYITSSASDNCVNPPFVQTRMSASPGGQVQYNAQTGLFTVPSTPSDNAAAGQENLPTERDVVSSHCMSSVTVFSVQRDNSHHGLCIDITDATAQVPIVVQMNATLPLGGMGLNTTVVIISNTTQPRTPPADGPPPAIPTIVMGTAVKTKFSMAVLACGLALAAAIL
ncbi:hypothetical protein OQA88_8578 [Cercophora sp. LCS_1]